MTPLKVFGLALIIAATLVSAQCSWMVGQGLYADWAFVRDVRIQMIQQQQQQLRQQQQPPTTVAPTETVKP